MKLEIQQFAEECRQREQDYSGLIVFLSSHGDMAHLYASDTTIKVNLTPIYSIKVIIISSP